MNKSTTRLAVTGGSIVLAALAIVLAQNDARKREREQPQIEPFAAQVAVPIPIDESSETWGSSPNSPMRQLLVRANNDKLTRYGSESPKAQNPDLQYPDLHSADLHNPEEHEREVGNGEEPEAVAQGMAMPRMAMDFAAELPDEENPLRHGAETLLDQSQVVLAAAGAPVEPPATGLPSTTSPPAWTGGGSLTAGAPSKATDLQAPASLPGELQSPRLPSFPMANGLTVNPAPPSTASPANSTTPSANPLPSLSASLPTLPPTITNEVKGMSDVQRPALPATNVGTQSDPPRAFPIPQANLSTVPNSEIGNGNRAPATNNYPAPVIPGATNRGQPTGEERISVGQSVTNSQSTDRPSYFPANDGNQTQPLRTAALAGLVSNQPGNRYLDGSQNPNMLIQKRAPEEIQVGKEATFVIVVRNAGNATAHDVRVVDSVPQGSRFVKSLPTATPDAQGILTWNLQEMAAGDERTITLQIVPEVQGEVGSNALVYFAAQASVRTVATLPKLELQMNSQPDMLIASRQQISVVVKNTGTGVARGVRLEADLPEQIKHDSGEAQLAASLGDMRPNDVQSITLDVAAVAPGQSQIVIRAVSDGIASAEERVALQVMAPSLIAQIEGPKLRYLERQATYQFKVRNNGTAAATNLDFVAHLPAGLKYNSSNHGGYYEPSQHTVTWGLYELPAGGTAPIEMTVLPVELGPQAIAFVATGDLGIKAEAKGTVTVDGLAELAYTIGQDNGTIETGSSSTYSVQITNVGNKSDKDVRLVVQLPNGSQLVDVDAQVKYRAEGNQIIFDPVPEMRNRDQYTFRFQVQHNQPGTQIVRTQLTSANWPVAVIKEEGTLVYNDQD